MREEAKRYVYHADKWLASKVTDNAKVPWVSPGTIFLADTPFSSFMRKVKMEAEAKIEGGEVKNSIPVVVEEIPQSLISFDRNGIKFEVSVDRVATPDPLKFRYFMHLYGTVSLDPAFKWIPELWIGWSIKVDVNCPSFDWSKFTPDVFVATKLLASLGVLPRLLRGSKSKFVFSMFVTGISQYITELRDCVKLDFRWEYSPELLPKTLDFTINTNIEGDSLHLGSRPPPFNIERNLVDSPWLFDEDFHSFELVHSN